MELEKFIEEDIKEFLDKKAEEQEINIPESSDETTEAVKMEEVGEAEEKEETEEEKKEREEKEDKDREEEKTKDVLVAEINTELDRVEELLNKGDLLAAVYLYKHLKGLFKAIPKKYYKERKETYDQLITCYYQIRRETGNPKASKPQQEPQRQEPKETEEQDIEEVEPDEKAEEDSDQPQEESPIAEGDSDSQEYKKEVEDEPGVPSKEKILKQMETVRDLIQKKEPRSALEEYEKLKVMFEAAEEDHEVSDEIFKDILSIRKSLRQLEEHAVDRKQRAPPGDVIDNEEESLRERVNREAEKAYKFLDSGEVKSAIIQYNKLRDRLSAMSIEDIELKSDLKEQLIKLHDDILEEQKQNMKKNEPEHGTGEIWDDISHIKHLIKNGDLDEAKEKFIEIQSKASNESKEERKKIYQALDAVKSKLHLAHSAKNMERMAEA